MTAPRSPGWILLALGIAFLFFFPWLRYLEIDACLDAGGSWDYALGECAGVAADYVTPGDRSAAAWLLLLIPPALAGILISLGLRAAVHRAGRRARGR